VKQIASSSRYRWYALGLLTVAQLCHAMDRSIVALTLEPIGKEFHLTDSQLGLLAGLAYGIAFACAAIPFGIAVDRFERRKLLAGAILVWSGCTALCGLATSYTTLLFSRGAVGAAEAGATPTSLSLLGDFFPPEKRSSAVGIWYMSAGLGACIAFLGGGYMVQHHGWRTAFYAAGAPGIVVSLLVFFTLREPPRGGTEIVPHDAAILPLATRFRLIAAQPGLIHIMAGLILAAIVLSGLATWLVTFFVRKHGLSFTQSGLVVAGSYGLLASLGGVVAGIAVDRINGRRTRFDRGLPARAAALTCVLTAVLTAVSVMAASTTVAIVMLLLAGTLATAYNGPANGLFVTLAPVEARGLAVSLLQFGANLVGMGVGPLIIGWVSQAAGPAEGLRWGLAVVLLFNLWAAIHFLLAARRVSVGLPYGR
jgi:MFS family permease